jgi:hypothetical protein
MFSKYTETQTNPQTSMCLRVLVNLDHRGTFLFVEYLSQKKISSFRPMSQEKYAGNELWKLQSQPYCYQHNNAATCRE